MSEEGLARVVHIASSSLKLKKKKCVNMSTLTRVGLRRFSILSLAHILLPTAYITYIHVYSTCTISSQIVFSYIITRGGGGGGE